VILLVGLLAVFPYFSLRQLFNYKIHFDRTFIIITLFLLCSLLSLFLNYQAPKNITNWIPYLWIFIGNYFFIRYLIRNRVFGIDSSSVINACKKCYFLVGGFIAIDFLLVNITGIQLRTSLINLDNGTANMDYFFRSDFINTGGVAEEPGIMSLMINIFFFICLFANRGREKSKLVLLYIFHCFILLCLGSTMGIVSFLAAHVLANTNWKFSLLFFIMAVGIFFILPSSILQSGFFMEMTSKLTLSEDVASSVTRATLWNTAWETFISHPLFGAGPGFGKLLSEDGFMSLGLIILAELGLVCFLLFGWFIYETYKKARVLGRVYHSGALKMAIICSTMHIAVLNEYYHMPYWLLLALIYCLAYEIASNDQVGTLKITLPEVPPQAGALLQG